ncbi:MAG: sigma-54-dependent Fis family transcriptional regulator [Candidatus Abyssobacteria bacterium SURF_17]|uniref:DNA-binding transcriptional regulator NtrC n=1 Tax=Candidatus Abyssobacteria bacterium SURF_17 TaxID=2093361 RepID=A0A419ET98_9BACT|nr:MAG: sigma-54-dependent Fis family transcriptional regulator [Candidatus Abyssubacteria bacterium SURF_17]
MRSRILIADDDESMRWVLSKTFGPPKYHSEAVANADDALAKLRESSYDVLLMDIRMPGMSGLEALAQAKLLQSDLAVIIITAYGTMMTAIEAMKWGAYDYVTKPFDVEELELTVEKALKTQSLARENKELRANLRSKYDINNLVGSSERMQEVYKAIGRVADKDVTVLIQGESGTGKELVARAVHYNSRRASKPFVPVNCVAIPENLLESEMFGHVKGAFTGATTSRTGKFEQADGGTLFLDEVADIGLDLQGKLLRVLQEHEIEPVGGQGTTKVDVRVIAATNRDLAMEIQTGRFREDLYYRLNVVPIFLPPLRERKEDISELAAYFIQRFVDELNTEPRAFDPAAIDLLQSYDWPGNVRELENLIKRIMVMRTDRAITPEHVSLALPKSAAKNSTLLQLSWDDLVEQELKSTTAKQDVYHLVLEKLEKPLLSKILERCSGNQVKAAEILGINRNTLFKKMKRLGLK